MIEMVEKHREQIAALCRKYGVQKLELFGSAAGEMFDPQQSDIDFIYEFDSNPNGLADRFFGLLQDLERLLRRAVDLLSGTDARNPFFLQKANQHRVTLYAA